MPCLKLLNRLDAGVVRSLRSDREATLVFECPNWLLCEFFALVDEANVCGVAGMKLFQLHEDGPSITLRSDPTNNEVHRLNRDTSAKITVAKVEYFSSFLNSCIVYFLNRPEQTFKAFKSPLDNFTRRILVLLLQFKNSLFVFHFLCDTMVSVPRVRTDRAVVWLVWWLFMFTLWKRNRFKWQCTPFLH